MYDVGSDVARWEGPKLASSGGELDWLSCGEESEGSSWFQLLASMQLHIVFYRSVLY